MDRAYIGRQAENAIYRVFVDHGYELVTMNFAVHNVGELDLVMRKNNMISIVEVKSRYESDFYQNPIEAITYQKRIKIFKTTQFLIRKFDLYDCDICYFAGCVTHNTSGIIQKIEIVPFE